MADPFLSEIRLFSFVFAPRGWALCNGQLLPINQNQALFSLLGTTFGGNGQTTFALPDLRSRVPMHAGSGHTLGERSGEQAHTLSVSELPTHTHTLRAAGDRGGGSQATPAGNLPGPLGNGYRSPQRVTLPLTTLHPGSITQIGGSQAHSNMQPFLTLSFCIALQGIFPSPN